MPHLHLETYLAATPQQCFDLSLAVDAHTRSMGASRERVVAGRTEGLLELGDSVTWRAIHFGMPFRMSVVISEHDAPHRFVDEQTRGPFRSWTHEHRFQPTIDGQTRMTDAITFASPVGPVGRLVDRLFLSRYLRRLVEARNEWLKQALKDGPH